MSCLWPCLVHDFRAGKSSLLASVSAGAGISLLIAVSFWTKARLHGVDTLRLTLGDYYSCFLAGIISQGFSLFGSGGRPFYLPATWLLTMLAPCYACLWYPRKDLEEEAAQVLLAL